MRINMAMSRTAVLWAMLGAFGGSLMAPDDASAALITLELSCTSALTPGEAYLGTLTCAKFDDSLGQLVSMRLSVSEQQSASLDVTNTLDATLVELQGEFDSSFVTLGFAMSGSGTANRVTNFGAMQTRSVGLSGSYQDSQLRSQSLDGFVGSAGQTFVVNWSSMPMVITANPDTGLLLSPPSITASFGGRVIYSYESVPVPEPTLLGLLLTGTVLGLVRRRRFRR